MSRFLSLEEVRLYESEIRTEFEALITSKILSARTVSKQWSFFRHCFEALLANRSEDFDATSNKITDYKFEITRALENFYNKVRRPVNYTFSLVHESDGKQLNIDLDNYPVSNRYLLLIRRNNAQSEELAVRESLIDRAISDAVQAEMNAYKSVPVINLSALKKCFDETGPAFQVISERLERCKNKNWTLQKPSSNPSYCQLISVKILELDETSAVVQTKEKFRLKWWSNDENAYTTEHQEYNETNNQTYILKWRDDRWLVFKNEIPKRRDKRSRRKYR